MDKQKTKVVGALWTLYDDLIYLSDRLEGAADLLEVDSIVECDERIREVARGIALVSITLRLGAGLDPVPLDLLRGGTTPQKNRGEVSGGG